MKRLTSKLSVQRGAAALATAVILLLVATIVVLYAGKVGIQDQRISGNDYRYKKAFTNAEAGLENRSAFLLRNKEGAIVYGTSTSSNFNHVNTVPYFNTWITQLSSSFQITSTGYADAYGAVNANGQATVKQQYGFYSLLGNGPDSPLIVAGNVPPVGNMEIVDNSNGGGTGVPVGVWTNQSVSFSGSGGTCQEAEYLANGSPSAVDFAGISRCDSNSCSCEGTLSGEISNQTLGAKRDIVQNDDTCIPPNTVGCFPRDLFEYVTGTPHQNYADYKDGDIMKITPAECNSTTFNANSNGIYWVDPAPSTTGTCDLPNGEIGGASGNNCGKTSSDICAVVLFAENTHIKMTGGSTHFFGIIFSFDRTTLNNGTDTDSTDNQNWQMSGSNVLYGVAMSDHSLSTSNIAGDFDLRYSRKVIEEIVKDEQNQTLAKVAGTWIDQD